MRVGGIFLSFEELEPDERPPRHIWMDGEELTAWFDNVKRRREEKYGGGGGDGGWDQSIQSPVSNGAAKDLIVGHG